MRLNTISVITVNYNNLTGLRDTFNSVVSQEYDKVQYIIIDGGSTDGSAEFIAGIADKLYYWISEKDAGVYQAMNKGIAKATGDYIVFLNSGDLFIDYQVVSKCCHAIEESVQSDLLYGNMFVVNQLNNADHFRYHPDKLTLRFFKNGTINHQSTLIKRTLFEEFGFYPENYKLASDYWLYIVCLLANKQCHYLGFPVAIYDLSGMSSLDGFKEYKIEQRKIWESTVPEYAQDLIRDVEQTEDSAAYCAHLLNYRIVKMAIGINSTLQKIRNILIK